MISVRPAVQRFWLTVNFREHFIEIALNGPMTPARCLFESLAIENSQFPPAVANQAGLLQITRRQGHTLPMRPEHLREKLLRDFNQIRLYTVMSNE